MTRMETYQIQDSYLLGLSFPRLFIPICQVAVVGLEPSTGISGCGACVAGGGWRGREEGRREVDDSQGDLNQDAYIGLCLPNCLLHLDCNC